MVEKVFLNMTVLFMDLNSGVNMFQRTQPEYNRLDLKRSVLEIETCSLSVSRGVGSNLE